MPGTSNQRPPKPYPNYPLFAHAKGYWAKKIQGTQRSFGAWSWPDAALYERSWRSALDAYNSYLEAKAHGRLERGRADLITLELLTNAYLTYQTRQQTAKVITARTFADCRTVCLHLRNAIGRDVTIADLEANPEPIAAWRTELETRLGWHAFNRHNAIAAGMFGWAQDPKRNGILGRPTVLRQLFVKRERVHLRRALRKNAAVHGRRRFEPDELRALIDHSSGVGRAQVLLGYFAAYGNNDLSELPRQALILAPSQQAALPPGWAILQFPRPKTEIDRAAVVPPVVAQALRDVMAMDRPAAEARWKPLVFRTESGFPFVRDAIHRDGRDGPIKKVVPIDSVVTLFRKLRDSLGKCPVHGWVKRSRGRLAGRPAAGTVGGRLKLVEWQDAVSDRERWDCCPCEVGKSGDGVPILCGRELQAMRKLGFRTFRRTATTFASGCTDNDVIHRWRGHALQGMSDVYVEDLEAHRLLVIAKKLLEKLHEGGECLTVSRTGSAPSIAATTSTMHATTAVISAQPLTQTAPTGC